MKRYILGIAILALMASCGGNVNSDGTPKETKTEIDSATNAGREAARRIIMREWTDSMEFQNAILEANAAKSKLQLAKKPKCEAAFDSAFVTTIRATRPDLARQLR